MPAVTDRRGEFAFRVAPVPARYVLEARAKGFKTERKSVSIQGEERADVFFQLEAESR